VNITLLSMQEDQEIQVAELVADGVPDDSGRIFEMGEDIVAAGESICEAVETSAVLENIEEIISSETAQIPPKAAEALMLSIEHMTARLGYKKKFSSLSLENYSSDPKKNIKQAMEGIKEVVGAVWDAIINAIDKVVGWVKDFFGMIFGRSSSTYSKACEIEIRLEKKGSSSEYKPIFKYDPEKDPKLIDLKKRLAKEQKDFAEQLEADNKKIKEIFKEHEKIMKDKEEADELFKKKVGDDLASFKFKTYPYVRISGFGLTGPDLKKHYLDTFKYLEMLFNVNVKNKTKGALECARTLLAYIGAENTDVSDLDDQLEKVQVQIKKLALELPDAQKKQGAAGRGHVVESRALLGDYCVYVNQDTQKLEVVPNHYKCGIDKTAEFDEIDEEYFNEKSRPHVISLQECLELSKLIKENNQILTKKEVDDLIQILDEISKEIRMMRKGAENEDKNAPASAQEKIKTLIKMIHSSQVKFCVDLVKYTEGLNSNLLAYIVRCEQLNPILANMPE
jgi:hypothetical protein